MPNEVYAIITRKLKFEPNDFAFLAWQTPAWDDDGYFWTAEKWFRDILTNRPQQNAWPHKFAFETKEAALNFINGYLKNEANECEIIRVQLG